MSDTTTTLEAVAVEADGWFERAERPDGESFTRLRDGAPEWMKDLVHDAHGSFLPDDWRYDAIRAACGEIADSPDADLDDLEHEWADGYADVYTNALFAWLSSNVQRQGYVDEAVEEFGYPEDRGITGAIAMGQYAEAREVFQLVRQKLEEQADEREDA